MVPTEGKWMARKQAVEFADFLAAIGRRSSNPGFELETIRDVTDNIHLATKQPEGVTYAEVDALSCIPDDSDPESVLLHRHMGYSVLMSMHSDRRVDEIDGAMAEMGSWPRPTLGLQTKAA
jgi:hypothetical protein